MKMHHVFGKVMRMKTPLNQLGELVGMEVPVFR